MNPQTFLSNFGHVANAPDGVKSLRQLVMASALAGKFSEPNEHLPSDIEMLLKEARSLHFRSTGKREKPLLLAAPLIHEFEIPVGWKWVRVGHICDLQTGATPSTQRPEYWGGDIPWLASGDVNLREIFQCKGRITEVGLANSNCKILPKNSVLIALNGQGKTRATVALLRIPAACNQSLVAMIPFDVRFVAPEYLFLSLRYRYYEIRDVTGQDQRRGLNMGLVSDLSVPLAPLAEQKRIVAKVDELMALCDQLEAQQQAREQRFPVLSRTCHARFAEAPTPANLNRIFDETGSISPTDLRRTILSLAVQGKLVPQDTTEEPAESLLVRLGANKPKASKSKKVKGTRNTTPLTEEDHPGLLPPSWEWARTDDICEVIVDCPHSTPRFVPNGIPCLDTNGFKDGKLIPSRIRYVSRDTYIERTQRLRPLPGDVVFAREGSVGASVIVPDGMECCLGQRVMLFRLFSPMLPSYFQMALSEESSLARLLSLHKGIGAKHVNVGDMRAALIPIPPFDEQSRIMAKIKQLMALVDHLEAQQKERDKLAEAFAKACIASFTGTTQLDRPEKMKALKTELVSLVTLGKKPEPGANASLAQLLSQNKGTLPAKSLWQQSGLTIDAFYQQLKTELAQGWIAPPAEAEMKILDEA